MAMKHRQSIEEVKAAAEKVTLKRFKEGQEEREAALAAQAPLAESSTRRLGESEDEEQEDTSSKKK
jgi:hypothetical protein